MEILAFVACGALTIFSFYSSALEYYMNIGNATSAGIRMIGIQLGIVVFGGLAVMQLFTTTKVTGPTKIGCIFGAIICTLLTIFLFTDSASTSYSYQDYKLGTRTAGDRVLEASIFQYNDNVKKLNERYDDRLKSLSKRRAELLVDKARLDAIVSPAVAAGTSLKKGYSEALSNVTSELRDNTTLRNSLDTERYEALANLDAMQSENATRLRSSNSSGASNISRMFNISSSTVILLRTIMCELALVALAIMFGVGLYYTSSDRRTSHDYAMTTFHSIGFLVMFSLAWSLFFREVESQRLTEEGSGDVPSLNSNSVPVFLNDSSRSKKSGAEQEAPKEDAIIQTELFGDTSENDKFFKNDGGYLPQASVGWDPEVEFDKMSNTQAPVMISVPGNCEIPADLFVACIRNARLEDRGIYAATAFYESTYRASLHKQDGPLGKSRSGFQIHEHYHPEIIKWMGNSWNKWDTSARAFTMVLQKQEQWRKGYDDWRSKLAYYNSGGTHRRVGLGYADRILNKAKTLQKYFDGMQSA
jgi:hypothetical protein